MSISQLFRNYKVSRTTIRKWINRPKNQVQNRNRPGRPRKISERISRNMKREMQQGGTLRKLAHKYSVSHTTVREHITKCPNPLYPYKVRTKPKLLRKNKQKCIEFCLKHKNFDITKWTFVDEKPF